MLLVFLKQFVRLNLHVAAEGVFAVIDSRRHYYDVLLGRVRPVHHRAQVIHVVGVADRDQDVARSHVDLVARDQRPLRNAELLHHPVLPFALTMRDTF